MLTEFGVANLIIDSKVKEVPKEDPHNCYVAMVETLNNRLQEKTVEFDKLGLIIIDEAHYNSFRKLFKYFEKQFLLGVTPSWSFSMCHLSKTLSTGSHNSILLPSRSRMWTNFP